MKKRNYAVTLVLTVFLIVGGVLLFIQQGSIKEKEELIANRNSAIASYEGDAEFYKEQADELEDDLAVIETDMEALLLEQNALIEENQDLTMEVETKDDLLSAARVLDYGAEIELERMGIMDVQVLEDNLRSQPELIGIPGVLGGTMQFGQVYILNEKYAYAYMSDGHIVAYGIYRFYVDDEQNITWDAILEDTIGSGDYDVYESMALNAYIEDGYLAYLDNQENFNLVSYDIDSMYVVNFEEDQYVIQLTYYFTIDSEDPQPLDLDIEPVVLQGDRFYYVLHYVYMELVDGQYVMTMYDRER